LGEFWGEHADKGIAGRTSLVAASVGCDILRTNAEGGIFLVADNFDMIGFFAELIVVRSSRGEGGLGVVGDNTDGATMTVEDRFEFESLLG
jgi:hypothetical protein